MDSVFRPNLLAGKAALVTGGGSGIGLACARALARDGAVVTAVSRTRSELDSLVREIEAAGGRAVAHTADLCEAGAPARAVAAAARQGRLSILVNNAAVGGFTSVIETSDEQWDRTLDTNLTAVFRLTREALPQLVDGGGHVFMISSLAAQNPAAGMAA